VFDNFGHFLLSTNSSATFHELNLYLLSNATYGTAIYYLDVCAIPDQHRGVWDRIKQTIAELVFLKVNMIGFMATFGDIPLWNIW
jgi:hypothetical protein